MGEKKGEKARKGVAKGGNATGDDRRGVRVCLTSENWSLFTGENLSSPLFLAQMLPPGLGFRLELMWAEVWVGG